MKQDKYQEAIIVITKEQEKIIGKNLSLRLINEVNHLKIDTMGNPILEGGADPKETLGELVDQYATVFGQASIEVSKEVVKNLSERFSPSELPENLQ